jgi:XTP/dITP diphosphohydrolase
LLLARVHALGARSLSIDQPGSIAAAPRGNGGFGYDPIFELPRRSVTVAELPAAEKNQLSHRGQALRGLVAQLQGEVR